MKDTGKAAICRAERNNEKRYKEVRRAFRDGDMQVLLGRYLHACLTPIDYGYADADDGESPADAGKRSKRGEGRGRLPNPAGFCRFLGLDRGAFFRLGEEFPTEVGKILAVFEDEALNSELSASVLGLYLRSLLGGDEREAEESGISVTFDHDILADGR